MKPEQAKQVTERIAAAIRSGTPPWRKPWRDLQIGMPLQWNGKPYSGINVLNLWIAGEMRGFHNPHWLTFNRAKALGGQVRKGAKAELSFFARRMRVHDRAPDADPDATKDIYLLRAYPVFCADEVDGLPARLQALPVAPLAPGEMCPEADACIAATGARIVRGGDKAFYVPSADVIYLPPLDLFESIPDYYSTSFHELIHWTGAESRLDRKQGKFGDETYAAEELIAEIGSAICTAGFGIDNTATSEQNAAYVANWLKALHDDSSWIFRVASAASRAASYILPAEAEADSDSETEPQRKAVA